MKANYQRCYRSKNGNTTFVYSVTGTATEIAEYETILGDKLRTDDKTGKPLFFNVRFAGQTTDLVLVGKDDNKKYIPDLSQFEAAASLAKQFGGNLGQEMARAAAATLLGKPTASASQAPVPEPEPEQETEE